MLKIKNNIDLIELEIFNFYDMGNCYQKYLEFGVQLYVDKQTRIITRNAPYDARYIPNKDEISDLIKADIVEDVAEEITYAYGVNLEEDIIIIEKQQKRIAELKKDLEFTTKTANELIEIKHKLEQELAELKEKAIVPRFRIGQTLFMIPTLFNSLKHITEYELLRLTLSDIGIRYELSIKNKEKGIEPYYCASEDMFDISIFTTEQEALNKLKEIQRNE